MVTPQRRHPLKRPGCIIGLIIWFLILLTPCFMIALAAQGEIAIQTGGAPEQRIRLWLIQEADQSGIGISTPMTVTRDQGICVETNVSFVLWRGQADATRYCECYVQVNDNWQTTSTAQGSCSEE